MSSAVLVQVKGWQRSFQPSMKRRMAAVRSFTLVKLPRRMAWRVMMPKKISTMFSHDPEVGVKCIVIRGFLASQVPHNFDGVFRQVVRFRLEWSVREGNHIFPETVELWNSLR